MDGEHNLHDLRPHGSKSDRMVAEVEFTTNINLDGLTNRRNYRIIN